MKGILLLIGLVVLQEGWTQVGSRLQKAYHQFEKDEQLRYAASSLYVIDAGTGKVVFEKNARMGLAPASTLKIITSVTAFELLGKDYRYKTMISISPEKDLYVTGSGDPTLGSWRWEDTKEDKVIGRIADALKTKGITGVKSVHADISKWESQSEPDGWIWQDLGNYYGAGARALNWRENQFDMFLKSGEKPGDPVEITGLEPELFNISFRSEAISAKKGTGDNAYIYLYPPVVRGTIPVNENRFRISGAMPDPHLQFQRKLELLLQSQPGKPPSLYNTSLVSVHTEISPPLDSIIYWFNKKSVNLYGEALIKTMAYEKQGFGRTDSGVNIVRNFWKEKGLDENELNLYDGSGLSPLNRVTTHAQVEILKYARTRDWFPAFKNAFPEYNGMSIKSGTISDVKGFAGYHRSKDGKEYIFSFLVNNYNGPTTQLVNKMFKVLDVLK